MKEIVPQQDNNKEEIPTPGSVLEEGGLALGHLQDFVNDLKLELEELIKSNPSATFNGRLERGIARAEENIKFLRNCFERVEEK